MGGRAATPDTDEDSEGGRFSFCFSGERSSTVSNLIEGLVIDVPPVVALRARDGAGGTAKVERSSCGLGAFTTGTSSRTFFSGLTGSSWRLAGRSYSS